MSINRTDPITVADLDRLVLLHVAELGEGAQCWVTSEEGAVNNQGVLLSPLFVLEKSNGSATSGDVFKPLDGSPIAGNADARWVRFPRTPAPPFFMTCVYEELIEDKSTNSDTPSILLSVSIEPTVPVCMDVSACFALGYDSLAVAALTLLLDGAPVKFSGDTNASAGATVQPGCIMYTNMSLPAGPHTVELQWSVLNDGGPSIHCLSVTPDSRQSASISMTLTPA